MQKTKKTKNTVPYLNASKTEKVLNLVSERSLINISPAYFKSYGFGHADAYLAINLLKFLGIIDENDKPTSIARKFQLRGETRNKEIEEVIRNAYTEIFKISEKPQNLSTDELINEFIHTYDLSPRVAKSAVPAFLKLCEFAGLKEKGSVRRTNKGTDAHVVKKRKTNSKLASTYKEVDTNSFLAIVSGREIQLNISPDFLKKAAHDAEFTKDLQNLTIEVKKFEKKYSSENNLDQSEHESG